MSKQPKPVASETVPTHDVERNEEELTASTKVELQNLFESRDFVDGYINVQTTEAQLTLEKIRNTPRQQATKRLNELIETAAMKALGELDVASARKRGKEFGLARRDIKEVAYNGTIYPLDESLLNTDLIDVLARECPVSDEELAIVQKQYDEALQSARTKLDQLRNELEMYRTNDDELKKTLEVWGNSLNAKGESGDNGKGFNAGVVHFFEYRAYREKASRFKVQDTDPSIYAFIMRSKQLGSLIHDYESNHDVERYAVVGDEEGQKRLYILSKGELIIAFQKPEDAMRVVSILPSVSVKDFEKRVDTEVKGESKEGVRLNNLVQHRQLLEKGSNPNQ